MAENTPSRADGAALVGNLMGEPKSEPAATQASPDELVAELTGNSAANGSQKPEASPMSPSDPTATEPPATQDDIFEKLRKAQKDAGKAGYELGKEREARQTLEEQVAQLQQQLQSLQNQPQQAAPQQPYEAPVHITSEQVDAWMAQRDRRWEDMKDDPSYRFAADIAANMVAEGLRQIRSEMHGISSSVYNMAFEQKLAGLGISRAEFDAKRKDPAVQVWAGSLSDEQFLAALASQAQMMGGRPSMNTPGGHPSVGAPTASGVVDPRTMIEQTQSMTGSTQNPRRLSHLKLAESLENGDFNAARKAAAPLFAALTGGQ